MPNSELDDLCINTLRALAMDMVQEAESGHPGLPMGAAAMAYTLWTRFLRFNPRDPAWPDRDRFVLSAGHGSALLYALLHVSGYDLPLSELRRFRQLGSRTPGHPERGHTPGVEATTGPLGQGLANATGMAVAESMLAARFNRDDASIVDHYTYAIVSDGDLMEGISSEVGSLAGHWRLGKLIFLYDDNGITIDGETSLAFSEDVCARFEAFGWQVLRVEDGNDVAAIEAAITAAREERSRPSFIDIKTHIGYGSPHKQDTASAHGEPLGVDEVRATKRNLGWPEERNFYIPEEALAHFRQAVKRGEALQKAWQARFAAYAERYPNLASEFERHLKGELPADWDVELPQFDPANGSLATRQASAGAINALAGRLPELVTGSGDLATSTGVTIKDGGRFSEANRSGRNIHFGVREHSMGAICNGIAAHGGFIPCAATFLIFSDYMRPAIRLAAMDGQRLVYVFTHDSIGLGEDGPTHQPVEHLLSLRAIPGLTVLRPADANEAVAAWRVAVQHASGPVALVLTRQKVPVLPPSLAERVRAGVPAGGYVLAEVAGGEPDIALVASGSEVQLALAARDRLAGDGVDARVVSFPSWELFAAQPEDYRRAVVPPDLPTLVIEAGRTLGWRSYFGDGPEVIGLDEFGASAPGAEVLREKGFSVDNVYERALALAKRGRSKLGAARARDAGAREAR